MTADIATLGELLVADRTLVGAVFGMDSKMVSQVAALGKFTSAVIDFALVVELLICPLYFIPAARHSFKGIRGHFSKFNLFFR